MDRNSRPQTKFTTVKEIAGKFGLSYQTINRYSDAGLLNIAFKKSNVRFYEKKHVYRRLKIITGLAKEGYSLMLIRKRLLKV